MHKQTGTVGPEVALADVSGHGEPVSRLGERLRALMHEHVNAWDQTDLMGAINNAFPKELDDSRYATAVLVGVYPETGDAVFTNAGHPLPLRYTARHREWSWMEEDRRPVHEVGGLPVGLIPGTRYHQTALHLDPGDLLVLYTDAFIEAGGLDHVLGPVIAKRARRAARTQDIHSPATSTTTLIASFASVSSRIISAWFPSPATRCVIRRASQPGQRSPGGCGRHAPRSPAGRPRQIGSVDRPR